MKILFVCTGNSCRSAMAKAYFEKRVKELGKTDVEVSSGGVIPLNGMDATKETIQVMKEEGVDISSHRTRMIDEKDMREADLIFVMEARHKEYIIEKYPRAAKKTYLLKEFRKIGDFKLSENPDIEDPIAHNLDFYKKTFAVIKESIERILKEI